MNKNTFELYKINSLVLSLLDFASEQRQLGVNVCLVVLVDLGESEQCDEG